jgi:hypothetical protein
MCLVALVFSGCTLTNGTTSTTTPPTTSPTPTPTPTMTIIETGTPTATGGLEIVSQEMKTDASDKITVELVLRNTSVIQLTKIKVTVKFQDAQGNLVDTSEDTITDVAPGQTVNVTIQCWGSCKGVVGYDLTLQTTPSVEIK